MKLRALNYELGFVPIKLILRENGLTNLFSAKNNNTVAETLASRRYLRLSSEVLRRYPGALNEKLGEFLYRLKINGDKFYLSFLNEYGDRKYCVFTIAESLKSKGL